MQVLRLHAFAFPLAEVAVAVAAAHPDFMPLLLVRLHQVRLLTLDPVINLTSGIPGDAQVNHAS